MKDDYIEKTYATIIPLIADRIEITRGKLRGQNLFRCPFCSDSQKNLNKGHLVINKNENFSYKCFKCGESGSINWLFHLLNINYRVKNIVQFRSKQSLLTQPKKIFLNEMVIDYDIVKYIFQRVGKSKLLLEKIKNLLVPDISRFVKENKISINTKILNIFEQDKFCSFRTFNNGKVICRNINKDSYFKHVVVNVENNNDFFLIHMNNIKDLYKKKFINVVISEGIFDALGFFTICEKLKRLHKINIFIASKGKSSLIKSLSYIFIKFATKINVTFLADHDAIHIIKNNVYPNTKHFIENYEILVNTKYKDFGRCKQTGYQILKIGGKGCLF